jgi:hypothetical protein
VEKDEIMFYGVPWVSIYFTLPMITDTSTGFKRKVLSIVTTNNEIISRFRLRALSEGKNIGHLIGQVFPIKPDLTSALVNIRCEGDTVYTLTVIVKAGKGGENPVVVETFWDE